MRYCAVRCTQQQTIYHCVAAGGDRVTAVHADGGLRERSSGPCAHRQFYAGGKISTCWPVCQFVSMFVRTITSERLNIGQTNLAVRYTVQKSRPSSKVKVKGQGHQGQKKRKTAESSPLTMHSRTCAVARPYGARSNRRYHCVPPRGWRPTPVGKSAHAL